MSNEIQVKAKVERFGLAPSFVEVNGMKIRMAVELREGDEFTGSPLKTFVPESALDLARAEGRAQGHSNGYAEGIEFVIREMNESGDQDLLRALHKIKAMALKWQAGKRGA